jgi:nucleoside-diphosphate-sugar epimerase
MYSGRKVLVTGGTGFIGSNLVEHLVKLGAKVRVISRGSKRNTLPDDDIDKIQGDLTELDTCRNAARGMEYIFHLAAAGGGLLYNMRHPAGTLTPNLLMNTNMLEAARLENVDRYLFVSSSSVYPPDLDTLVEEKAWEGNPHGSDSFFAWSKRMGELQAIAYAEEYGMSIALVRLGNPYGPKDNFDLETSHVIPALIYKAIHKINPFVVLGAGEAVRSFVHVKDVVNAMTRVLEVYSKCDPVNIASGDSVKIKDLVSLVLELTNYKGELKFDTSKPEGHLLKVMDIKKLEREVGYKPTINLRDGIQDTISWYLNQ